MSGILKASSLGGVLGAGRERRKTRGAYLGRETMRRNHARSFRSITARGKGSLWGTKNANLAPWEESMSAPMRGILAGLIATIVLSGFMVLRLNLNIVPEINIVAMLGKMGGNPPAGAWTTHFVVGALLWGFLFAGFSAVMPGPYVVKGMIFGSIAWIAMMLLFLPAAGVGRFGSTIGLSAPAVTLVLHLIYGAALGLAYGILTQMFPETDVPVVVDAEAEVLRKINAAGP
jgi:hypothetical protein